MTLLKEWFQQGWSAVAAESPPLPLLLCTLKIMSKKESWRERGAFGAAVRASLYPFVLKSTLSFVRVMQFLASAPCDSEANPGVLIFKRNPTPSHPFCDVSLL